MKQVTKSRLLNEMQGIPEKRFSVKALIDLIQQPAVKKLGVKVLVEEARDLNNRLAIRLNTGGTPWNLRRDSIEAIKAFEDRLMEKFPGLVVGATLAGNIVITSPAEETSCEYISPSSCRELIEEAIVHILKERMDNRKVEIEI